MIRLHILGCGSATPTERHLPACQVLEVNSRLMMIDCGEGASHSMLRQKLKFSRLDHIFISHLHADHCMGLPGLINIMVMNGRRAPLTVHTFAEGEEIFRRILSFFCPVPTFPLEFNIIVPGRREVILHDDINGCDVEVEAFALRHRVPASGFLFRFASRNEPPCSYAYCSDTVYMPELVPTLAGVDLLYHEATYAGDRADKAALHFHSTAAQAADIARAAGAARLLLGHFASSYRNEEEHLRQAREIFPRTEAACEGLTLTLTPKSDDGRR